MFHRIKIKQESTHILSWLQVDGAVHFPTYEVEWGREDGAQVLKHSSECAFNQAFIWARLSLSFKHDYTAPGFLKLKG